MMVLVANIGSTSFKYRLYEMPAEQLVARGGVERLGSPDALSYIFIDEQKQEWTGPIPDYGTAIAQCLAVLAKQNAERALTIDAVGFKAVHAYRLSGVQRVSEPVLMAMERFFEVVPAHNPPYVQAMRQIQERFPNMPLVAAFETGFHATVPQAATLYAVPWEWYEKYGIQRYGFHGASHRFIAERAAQLQQNPNLKLISCHLGGSSSLAASLAGKSIGTSMGMTPQSGLPQNNRVGDFDLFALPFLLNETGQTLSELLDVLARESGLLGVSGCGNDMRDIELAALAGNERAKLTIDMFVSNILDYIGSYVVRLGGLDLLVFTGGIGENSVLLRQQVCHGLRFLGLELDETNNSAARGEEVLTTPTSRIVAMTIPTNEEIVVARQTYTCLQSS